MSVVDVIIITYNHEKLIETAIMSALSQQTNKIANIYVCNDNSKDGTANVIENLRANFPGRITHIFRSQNYGMNRNFREAILSCTSPYVAILEGDDFWCDENKIEQQLSMLEKNPNFVACVHPIKAVDGFGHDLNQIYPMIDVSGMEVFDAHKIIPHYYPGFHVNSIFARTEILKQCFIKEFDKLPIGDVPLHYMLMQKGKIAYIAKPMSVWRQSTQSYFNGQSVLLKVAQSIHTHYILRPYLNKELNEIQWQVLKKIVKLFDFEYNRMIRLFGKFPEQQKISHIFNYKYVRMILNPSKYPDQYGRFSFLVYIRSILRLLVTNPKNYISIPIIKVLVTNLLTALYIKFYKNFVNY